MARHSRNGGRGRARAAAAMALAVLAVSCRRSGDTPPPAYAGSAACAPCHAAEYAAWRGSHHARAQEPANAQGPAAAFARPPGSRAGGRRWIEAEGADGRRALHPVDAAIGVSPLVQFLVAFDRGRLQPTALAWDPRREEWFDLHAAEGRRAGEWGHWTGRGMTWNLQCASCHVTAYRKNYDPERDVYESAWAEAGVGCEACHGPRAVHVAQARAGGRLAPPAVPPPAMETCMPCHSRRRQVGDDFVPGAPGERRQLLDVYEPVLPDDAAYYPDGQIREEDYEWASFQQSRMRARGVTCRDCHDPHAARLRAPGDGLCLRCHEWQLSTPAHTHHAVASTGARCAACHMPQTTYMLRHARRDHSMSIPDARLTRDLGIPNACGRCHRDRDAAWAARAQEQWYGRHERPQAARARLVSAARRGGDGAVAGLLALMEDAASPAVWRAAAAGLLQPWAGRADVTAALTRACQARDPLLRLRAARALAPAEGLRPGDPRATTLARLLGDEARVVRLDAAWALRRFAAGVLPEGSGRALLSARAELLPALAWNADAPGGRYMLALYHGAQGRFDEAERELRAALRLDPLAGQARLELAGLLAERHRLPEAVAVLEEGAALAPADAAAHYALGIAYAQAGRPQQAVSALEVAVALAPEDAEARQALAIASARAGRVAAR